MTDTASTGEGKEGSIEAWTDSLGTQVLQVKGWDGTGTETTYALTAVSSDAGAVFESPDSQVTHFLIRQGEDAQNNLDMQYAKLKLTLPLSAMPAGSSVSADSDITSLS